jgi:hypothetical protein
MNKKALELVKALSIAEIPFLYHEASDTGQPVITIHPAGMESPKKFQVMILVPMEGTSFGLDWAFIRVNELSKSEAKP